MSPGSEPEVAPRPDLRPFRLRVVPEREVVRVCPSGDIDLSTVGVVRDQVAGLTAAGFASVVVDLREVTFLDSMGVHLMLDLAASSRMDGWRFAIIEGPADVNRPFEVTGLRAMLPFVHARAIALGSWRANDN